MAPVTDSRRAPPADAAERRSKFIGGGAVGRRAARLVLHAAALVRGDVARGARALAIFGALGLRAPGIFEVTGGHRSTIERRAEQRRSAGINSAARAARLGQCLRWQVRTVAAGRLETLKLLRVADLRAAADVAGDSTSTASDGDGVARRFHADSAGVAATRAIVRPARSAARNHAQQHRQHRQPHGRPAIRGALELYQPVAVFLPPRSSRGTPVVTKTWSRATISRRC
jgi:hypothetical protein